jgi:hypothetical protein
VTAIRRVDIPRTIAASERCSGDTGSEPMVGAAKARAMILKQSLKHWLSSSVSSAGRFVFPARSDLQERIV